MALRRKLFASLFATVFLSGFAMSCASGPAADDEILEEEEEMAPLKAQSAASSAAPGTTQDPNAALLYFFANGDKGVEINNIDWQKPLSSENPGADCELRSRTPGIFACVVKNGKDAVVLTIHEAQTRQGRVITKMTLDGKGSATRERWITELKGHNYQFLNERPGRTISRQTYQAIKSRVDVIWVPAKQAVTLIFRAAPPPAPPAGAKPAAPADGSGSGSAL